MRVLFITNIPSPYRVDFFNELGKYCDLTVLYEKASSDERNDYWKKYHFETFKGIVLRGISTDVDKALCLGTIKYLKKFKHDIIVIANTITPTGMLEIAYLKIFKIRYFLEADGAIYRGDNFVKKIIKTFLMSKAHGYFSSADSLDDYFSKYGAPKNRIYRYPFTSVHKKQIIERILSVEEKREQKNKLSIQEDRMVLYVGQFIHRKGIDLLLRSWSEVEDINCGLYLIGGKLTSEYKGLIEQYNLHHVHVIEFMEPAKLSEYYKAADIFVLPTREDIWGLVVNEALSYGLPVITTQQCVAGLEMIKDGKNGYLYDVEDIHRLSEIINDLMKDDDLRKDMSECALSTALKYTIEEMAEAHMNVFNRYFEKVRHK